MTTGASRTAAERFDEDGEDVSLRPETALRHFAERGFRRLLGPGGRRGEGAYAAYALDHFGGLDMLINNAGIAGVGHIERTTVEEWDRRASAGSQ